MNDNWRDDDRREEAPQQEQVRRPSSGRGIQPWLTATFLVVGLAIAFVMAQHAVTSALLFIFILLALVLAHEAAHFATAKMFGIRVHEFGVGFPPRIAGKRFGETEYTVNWLPIGGFVRLEGEENPTGPRSLAARPAWQRLIVLASGAVINLVLPVFLFAGALMIPHEIPEGNAEITQVIADTPAAEAGLQEGDVILAIEGRTTKNLIEASRYVRVYQGKTIEILVRRGGEELTVPVYARWSFPEGQGPTGIQIAPVAVASDGSSFTVTESQAPWTAVGNGFRLTWDTMILARNQVVSWFKGASGPEFQGPVGIAQTTGEVASAAGSAQGAISPLLELAALLSINLGILNLLPLPMLDGGRMFFVVVEVLRGGKRVAPEREALVHLVGFVAFMALALVVTFYDVSRIASGDSILR
ncbi:MAG: RIP metalloprotease [Dehalococcoidia bacterium]